MSRDRDPVKWAAVTAVCEEFRKLLHSGECDQLCRMATHTGILYGTISGSATAGDTPAKVSDRVRFVREFRDKMWEDEQQWDNMIARMRSKKRGFDGKLWICPRCGQVNCAGATEVRVIAMQIPKQ